MLQYLPSTRFSLSVSNGEEFESFLGEDHPVSLGDGYIDAIPIWTRDNIWQPMNIGISIQWLLIGLGAGFLLGGSQGMRVHYSRKWCLRAEVLNSLDS